MNKIQKKIHKLTMISVNWCNGTEYQFIPYREHRTAWRKEVKNRRYTKSDLIQKNIADQTWHVIYCLQEYFGILDDRFERCRVCGDIYDSYSGGTTIDCDSEPYMTETEDYTYIEREWKDSEYGNYCQDCRPD